jgi:branched-subunit amino acid ABC-type transport system permease component
VRIIIATFIILGATSGSVYGLAGMGLVLTYKTSGVFNLAFGSLATISAYLYYALHVQASVPWPLAALAAVVVVGVVSGLLMARLGARIAAAPVAVQVGATVGILVGVEAAFVLIYGTEPKIFPSFLPTQTFRLWGTGIGVDDCILVAVGVIATIGLYVLLRSTSIGRGMRAVVDNPELLDLMGTSPARVRRFAWVLSSFAAAVSGLLLAPDVNLDSTGLTLLVVQAFGAAAIGGFTSLPGTYLGGLTIGIAESIATKYSSSGNTVLLGLPSSVPFIVLFLVLTFAPRRWARASTSSIG